MGEVNIPQTWNLRMLVVCPKCVEDGWMSVCMDGWMDRQIDGILEMLHNTEFL